VRKCQARTAARAPLSSTVRRPCRFAVIGNARVTSVSFLIAVAAVLGLFGCNRAAWREAQMAAATAAIEQALMLRTVLQQSRKCPIELVGWKPEPQYGRGILITQAGNARLFLDCDQVRGEFSVAISYSIDDQVFVGGPFDGPLSITYGHHTAYKTKVIPENPDLPALARLLAFDRS